MMIDPLAAHRRMAEFRAFEEEVGAAVSDGTIHGEMHLAIGQEAVAAGVEPALRAGDAIVSTHRPHLHALIAGVDPVRLLAELFERDGGLSGGKGGHMHLFDPEHDFMCTGIVGASAPLALGYALERRRRADGTVAVAVLGDGAANHGTLAECLNMAALWSLPIVFLVEDNGYGISVSRADSTAGEVHERGAAYGVPGGTCDGTDPAAVAAAAAHAFAAARDGRPALLVARAHRFRGHYEGDLDLYRTPRMREEMVASYDPLTLLRDRLRAAGTPDAELDRLAGEAIEEVRGWVAAARALPPPAASAAREGVFV